MVAAMSDKLLVNRLRHRVTIWRPRGPDDPPPQRDEYGEPINEPIKVATVWAAIEPFRGREYHAAGANQVEVTTRIRIRYRDGIDRTMIVRHGDTAFEILHIIRPEFGKKELQLMCKERQ